MNRTLLTLTGLLLAAPLAAQQPSANEIKASKLLQLSAEKAMAGYENEAQKLAEKAMELLQAPQEFHRQVKTVETLRGKVVMDHAPQSRIVIVEGADGQQVLEVISEEAINVDSEGNFSFGWSTESPEEMGLVIDLKALGYAGDDVHEEMVWIQKPSEGGEYIVRSGDASIQIVPMLDGEVVHEEYHWSTAPPQVGEYIVRSGDASIHLAPMANGDLHQQLREIQHELESLRHELHALRSEMGGGRRGGMQGQRRVMRFGGGGGNWVPEGNLQLRGGKRLHYTEDFQPGQMQRIELHGIEGLPQDLRLHTLGLEGLEGLHSLEGIMELQGMHDVIKLKDLRKMHETGQMGELHEMHFGDMEGADFDFDFELDGHDGAEVHKEVVVIVNGEKFTGDAAVKKLEELNMGDMTGGKIRMRVEGHKGAFPTPPEPPKAPRQNRWRSKGHDHEDA
ncbi:MAG: hypothetical protein COA70_06525 [Planctomycetota bacterium]|nr:MAG: hypothetical protein COA70_06525 [Planctomycetota bacterium]